MINKPEQGLLNIYVQLKEPKKCDQNLKLSMSFRSTINLRLSLNKSISTGSVENFSF